MDLPANAPHREGVHVFGRIGIQEILIILVVLVFLFGAKKIPELARGLGLGVKEFRKGLKDLQDPDDDKKDSGDEPEGPTIIS